MSLTHLQRLEAESIHIMREVVAETREAGDAVFDRQGQRGDAAPRAQGLLPGAAAVSAAARRHDLEVPGDVRVPRPAVADGSGMRAASCTSIRRRGARHQPVHARLGACTPTSEDAGAEAGARQVRLRRRVRRRAPRRGEVARQGAHVLVPLGRSIAGTRRTSGRSSGASTTRASTRARAIRVFPLSNWTELDVWQYIHLREHPDRAAVLRRPSGRWSSATAR